VGWCDNPIIFAGCGHLNPIEMESSRFFCGTYNGKREEAWIGMLVLLSKT